MNKPDKPLTKDESRAVDLMGNVLAAQELLRHKKMLEETAGKK